MNNANWWANKLAQTTQQPQVGRPDPTPPMPMSQQPMQVMPTFQPPQAPSKAASSRQTDTCPECGSANFMAASPREAQRCFECGYPVSQSGSRYGSLTGAHVDGTAKQATGNNIRNNWNPQEIIGRIGE